MSGHGNRDIFGIRWSLGVPLFLESGLLDVEPLLPYGDPKPCAKVYPTTEVFAESSKVDEDYIFLDEIKAGKNIKQIRDDVRLYESAMDSLAIDSSLEIDDPDDYKNGKFVRLPTSDKRYGILTNTAVCHFATNTGKMKLWAQSVMGRNDTDAYLVGLFVDAIPDKYMTGLFFRNQSVSMSQGLLTTSDHTYYLIELVNGEMFATLCEFRAKSVKKILENNEVSEEEKYKRESYALSDLTLNAESRIYSIPITGPEVIGEALSYGWKFNWSGHKASIVTIEKIYDGLSFLYNTNRLYTITITDEEVTENNITVIRPVSATIELIEEKNCTPQPIQHSTWKANPIYYPDHQYHYWFHCGQNSKIYSSEVPVYCWYGKEAENIYPYYNDEGEILILVRFTLEPVDSPGSTEYDPALCGVGIISGEYHLSGTWAVDRGGFYISYENTNFDEKRNGTCGSGGTYELNIELGSQTRERTRPYEQASVSYPCIDAYSYQPDPPGIAGNYYLTAWKEYGYGGSAHYTDGNRDFEYSSALIIPFWSAESVNLAESNITRWSALDDKIFTLNCDPGSYRLYSECINQGGFQWSMSSRQIVLNVANATVPKDITQIAGERYSGRVWHLLYGKQGKHELFNQDVEWGNTATYHNGVRVSVDITPASPSYGSYVDAFSPVVCGAMPFPYHETLYVNLESVLGTVVASSSEATDNYIHTKYTNDTALPTDYDERTNQECSIMFVGWT